MSNSNDSWGTALPPEEDVSPEISSNVSRETEPKSKSKPKSESKAQAVGFFDKSKYPSNYAWDLETVYPDGVPRVKMWKDDGNGTKTGDIHPDEAETMSQLGWIMGERSNVQ